MGFQALRGRCAWEVLFMLPAALWPPGLTPLPPVEGRLSLAPCS